MLHRLAVLLLPLFGSIVGSSNIQDPKTTYDDGSQLEILESSNNLFTTVDGEKLLLPINKQYVTSLETVQLSTNESSVSTIISPLQRLATFDNMPEFRLDCSEEELVAMKSQDDTKYNWGMSKKLNRRKSGELIQHLQVGPILESNSSPSPPSLTSHSLLCKDRVMDVRT